MTELEQRLLTELEEAEKREQRLFDEYIKSLRSIEEEFERNMRELAEQPVKISLDESFLEQFKQLDDGLAELERRLAELERRLAALGA